MLNVLMLHRVLPKGEITYPNSYAEFGTLISLQTLENVICKLIENNFCFVKISEIENSKNNQIALTFDDGYLDNFLYAYPLLKKYNINATFFPVIEPCLKQSVLPIDFYYQFIDEMELDPLTRNNYIRGEPKKAFYWTEPKKQLVFLENKFGELPKRKRVQYMNSEQIKELYTNGNEIGSHGITHSLLTANYISEKTISEEIIVSKEILEKIISGPVKSFCFPSGYYNTDLINFAKNKNYTSVCLIKKNNHKDFYSIPAYERFFFNERTANILSEKLKLK